MQIKIIAVGSSKWDRFIRRWGISLLIDGDILFDTFGDPGVFLNNARKMNVDFSKIRHVVLSHDDWDHISGLWYLLRDRKDITVYICPAFKHDIKDRISSFGVKVVESGDGIFIKEGVYSTGQLCAEFEEDKIYEQSLVIKSEKGLVIITGCAHPGIVNIVDSIRQRFNENIYLIMGGLHLKDKAITEIKEVMSKLRSCGVEKIAPLHCMGKVAERLFKAEYKDNCILIKPGQAIEF
ncbi:MAG: MBL fold metallo-hydrolase [Candidatus Omnitrophota bacterium]